MSIVRYCEAKTTLAEKMGRELGLKSTKDVINGFDFASFIQSIKITGNLERKNPRGWIFFYIVLPFPFLLLMSSSSHTLLVIHFLSYPSSIPTIHRSLSLSSRGV